MSEANHLPRRIAVVGAGVSGLVAAHLLAQDGHAVVVFEAAPYAGGHTNTIDVATPRGGTLAVDTGFIVFNDRNYPQFEALLAELGVASRPSDMSFGVSDAAGTFAYASSSPRALFATPRHLADRRFHAMLRDVRRFQRDARALLATPAADHDPPLRAWLEERGYGEWFVERLIVPQATAVWSADPAQMSSFPARFLAQFFANHGMLELRKRPQWRTIAGGSRTYVDALLRRLDADVRLATPVVRVERSPGHVTITPERGAPERFDDVVLATHADTTLALLGPDATPLERELLGAFPYQPSEAVLHTDTRLLPRRRAAWASWNAHLLDPAPPLPTVTYDMNRLQGLDAPERYLVTLNRTDAIDPATVIRRIAYAHPAFTRAGVRAQQRHHEISGHRRTHYAGAYWGWGFHEDGVASAHRAVATLRAATGHAAPRERLAA